MSNSANVAHRVATHSNNPKVPGPSQKNSW